MNALLLLALLAIIIVLVFDCSNGFHDAANIIATVIASRAMSPVQAVLLVGVFELLGPLLGGTAVANTIGSFVELSDVPPIQAMEIILAGLIGAIGWNLITWWKGLPSSSSHALVGGLIGAVIAGVGGRHVVWGFAALLHGHVGGVAKVVLALLLSPVAGFVVGFLIQRIMSWLLHRAKPRVNRYLRGAQFFTAMALARVSSGNSTSGAFDPRFSSRMLPH